MLIFAAFTTFLWFASPSLLALLGAFFPGAVELVPPAGLSLVVLFIVAVGNILQRLNLRVSRARIQNTPLEASPRIPACLGKVFAIS